MAPAEAPIAEKRSSVGQACEVVLAPISDASLGMIRIRETLFAIGRGEAPFATLPEDRIAALSRRHARIFFEDGHPYVADLGSKNGTSLNGSEVRDRPQRLFDGDELSLGGALVYRVRLEPRVSLPVHGRTLRTVGLVMSPERTDLGLHELDVSSFPFLISKTDERFARYRKSYPHQVNYISRRHAHLFINDDVAYIEDLGSTNGTFVNGKRLQESALGLHDGDMVAFGGNYFSYRVRLRREPADATLTRLRLTRGANDDAADADKTTFVAAANSFLDIFCVDPVAREADEINKENAQSQAGGETKDTKAPWGGRFGLMTRELVNAFSTDDPIITRRRIYAVLGAVVLVIVLAVAMYMNGGSERSIRDAMSEGRFEDAALQSDRYLARRPADVAMTALGTEAVIKAQAPSWIRSLGLHDLRGADAAIQRMRSLSTHNPDASTLADELQWANDLERFVLGRGGVDAPIRIYSDEATISELVKRWDNDPPTHQRALDRVASWVPAFGDVYANVLSHLRKLQSDNAVYLPAMDRLNSTIVAALGADNPGAVKSAIDDAADKYPRLGGLDRLRDDLVIYTAIDADVHDKKLGDLIDRVKAAHFSTPPFAARFAQMKETVLPSAEMTRTYEQANAAWHAGKSKEALASLGSISSPGPWADTLGRAIAHKRVVVDEFGALQAARGTPAYEERLLGFFGNLEPVDDVFYVHAVQGDVDAVRDKAVAHARELIARAQAEWLRYRDNGAIGGTQRLEAGMSEGFRSQAHLLTDAHASARQGVRILTELNADLPADYTELVDALDAEVELQRRSLEELRMVLDPSLLKAKLALIGGDDDEVAKSP